MAKMKNEEKYEYPSRYGSHSSMIDNEETKALNDPDKVVLRDENGSYVTERNRIDSGLADPNRFALPDERIANLVKAAGGIINVIM